MGLIIPQNVFVKIGGKNKSYFISKGYNLDNIKLGNLLEVNVLDLLPTSLTIVKCKCDYCGKEFENKFLYISNKEKLCCGLKCSHEKIKENFIKNHGVAHQMHLKETKDKIKKTCIEKYGVDNPCKAVEVRKKMEQSCLKNLGVKYPSQSAKVKDKIKNTCIKNYGTDHISKSDIIKEKKKETTIKNYGVDNPWKAAEVKEKIKQTWIEKYGVDNPMKNEEIKKKSLSLGLPKGKFPSSKQQRYLCKLLTGDLKNLNKFLNNCICDIMLKDKKIIIEYDGSGHWMQVNRGWTSLEEFNHKEILREKRILKCGYKIIRIISKKDLLPTKDEIIEIINILINKISNFNIIKLDIDNKIISYDNVRQENISFKNLNYLKGDNI
jgi:very-short-patch-repair endonuclease